MTKRASSGNHLGSSVRREFPEADENSAVLVAQVEVDLWDRSPAWLPAV